MWRYQAIRKFNEEGDYVEYAIHEIFDLGHEITITDLPVSPYGESKEELLHTLELMRQDVLRHGVRDYDEFPIKVREPTKDETETFSVDTIDGLFADLKSDDEEDCGCKAHRIEELSDDEVQVDIIGHDCFDLDDLEDYCDNATITPSSGCVFQDIDVECGDKDNCSYCFKPGNKELSLSEELKRRYGRKDK